MPHRYSRSSRRTFRRTRAFVIALVALAMTTLLAAPDVSADPAIDGPQLLMDQLVVPPGVPVTVTLNRFQAGQHVVLHVRSSLGDQGVIALAFPGTLDTIGSGAIVIPTTGFGIGNYIVSVMTEGSPGELDGVLTAFAIVSPGFTGPRVVRAEPLPRDDQG